MLPAALGARVGSRARGKLVRGNSYALACATRRGMGDTNSSRWSAASVTPDRERPTSCLGSRSMRFHEPVGLRGCAEHSWLVVVPLPLLCRPFGCARLSNEQVLDQVCSHQLQCRNRRDGFRSQSNPCPLTSNLSASHNGCDEFVGRELIATHIRWASFRRARG
jgi:hypothetical protein